MARAGSNGKAGSSAGQEPSGPAELGQPQRLTARAQLVGHSQPVMEVEERAAELVAEALQTGPVREPLAVVDALMTPS